MFIILEYAFVQIAEKSEENRRSSLELENSLFSNPRQVLW